MIRTKIRKGQRSRGRPRVAVPEEFDRTPPGKRQPIAKQIAADLKRWLATIDSDVRDTFDYSAIEFRVVWSFDNATREHYQELIVSTEGRRSR